jgi:hypothetical protein
MLLIRHRTWNSGQVASPSEIARLRPSRSFRVLIPRRLEKDHGAGSGVVDDAGGDRLGGGIVLVEFGQEIGIDERHVEGAAGELGQVVGGAVPARKLRLDLFGGEDAGILGVGPNRVVSLPDPIHREADLLPRILSAREEGARKSTGGAREKCPTRSCRLHLDLLKREQDARYRERRLFHVSVQRLSRAFGLHPGSLKPSGRRGTVR